MNKKLNTILFILGATIFNVIVTILSFILFSVLYQKFIMPLVSDAGKGWSFNILFIMSLAVSFLVYRIVLKTLLKRIDAERYFDPLFAGKFKNSKTPPQA